MVAGVALGSICPGKDAGTIGPACHLCTPLPWSGDVLAFALRSSLEEAELFLPAQLWPCSEDSGRSLGVWGCW